MARRPLGNPSRANRPVESVTTNLLTSGAEIITPAMGRPLKAEMAAPRMWAPVSGRDCACSDAATIAAVTSGTTNMVEPLSPTHWLALILPLEPGDERLEIIYNGCRVRLPFAGRLSENLLPRLALPRRQHAGQLLPRGAVAIDRAAVQRSRPPGRAAPRPMQLELQDVSQEIPHVRHVGGDVVFRARIEVTLRAGGGLRDALVAMLHVPPCCGVLRGCDLPRENSPAPPVERERERQEGDLVERYAQQHRRIARCAREAVEQTDALE